MEYFILEDGTYCEGDPNWRPDDLKDTEITIVPRKPAWYYDWKNKEWVINEEGKDQQRKIITREKIQNEFPVSTELKIIAELLETYIPKGASTEFDSYRKKIVELKLEAIDEMKIETKIGDSINERTI